MLMAALRMVTERAALVMVSGALIGLALPALAADLRPWVVPVGMVLVMLSILRVDPERLGVAVRRPGHVLLVSGMVLLGVPLLVGVVALALGAPDWLAVGLTLAAAAPPLSSAAAFAIMLRIDAAEVTAISLPATLLSPLTVWLITAFGPGMGAGLDTTALVLRLGLIVAGSFALAFAIRRIAGAAAVDRVGPGIDALTLLLIVVMGVGIMDDINIALRSDPLAWTGILLAAAAVMLSSCLLLGLAFWRTGRDRALAAAVAGGFRNMALMVAAISGTLAPEILLVVITAQMPLFFAPMLLRPVFARIGGR